MIIFADADLDDAVGAALAANMYSSGQVCSNATRSLCSVRCTTPLWSASSRA